MFKVDNESANNIKANISQDVVLDIFAYITIIAVCTFTCLYTNLLLLIYFSVKVSNLRPKTKGLSPVPRYAQK